MELLIAFIIGLAIGWILSLFFERNFWRSADDEIMSARACQQQLDVAQARVAELETAAATAVSKLQAAGGTIAELEDRLAAAQAAAAVPEETTVPVDPDDLTRIEGIGPKIDGLLKAAGIMTFAQLAETAVDHLKGILAEAGPRYALANPESWGEQAALAAAGSWDELAALQDSLKGGVRE